MHDLRAPRRPRRRSLLLAAALAIAAITGSTLTTTIAAADDAALPEITTTTSAEGFTHPGVGLTTDQLENARAQVQNGVEPWKSYFEALESSPFAQAEWVGDNVTGVDDPASDAYNEVYMRTRAYRDSVGAMDQTLRYYITGDEVYRYNAMRVLRAWSKLDPEKYSYFADAHIHTGVPLYQFLVAADILRSITPVNETYNGYDLRWNDDDTARVERNLIRPHLSTFLNSQNRYLNQHNYGVQGAMAGAIFLDDTELYEQRVEWFTVNSTFDDDGDWNGSVASLFREISADDPLNPTGEAYVQHQEMGRDQAHGWGDVVNFGVLARMVNNQGTRLDPVAGTVSDAADAVSPYAFLDDRILKGADAFAAYMMGEDVPWIDTTGGPGALSQAYRGRYFDPMSELYYQYKYVADVDVEAEAPAIAEVYENRIGPRFYWGTSVKNVFDDFEYHGAEYWAAFPAELAQQDVTVPSPSAEAHVDAGAQGHPLGEGASIVADDDGAVLRLDASKDDASAAIRQLVWGTRDGSSLVGLRVRSAGEVTLEARRTRDLPPYATFEIPNTHGEWRYITWNVGLDHLPASAIGENILFLDAVGTGSVDIEQAIGEANGRLTPPTFADGDRLDTVAVAGEEFSRTVAVDDEALRSVTASSAPDGASVSDAGAIEWTPTEDQLGAQRLVIAADDGATVQTLVLGITVAADRASAIDLLEERRDPDTAYTEVTAAAFDEALTAASNGAEKSTDAEFGALIEELRIASEALAPVNPHLSDGTLDFSEIATSGEIPTSTMASLVDGDNQSMWGDLRIKNVTFDFGADFRVSAERFGFLARNTFANRSQGTNAYGSNDGSHWTLLTERASAGNDSDIEYIPVAAELRDEQYRFIRFQVDEPGVPSDPAYPGIWSLADIRIDGMRHEVGNKIASISIDSADAVAGKISMGDSVRLRVTARESLVSVTASVQGVPLEMASDDGITWQGIAALENTEEGDSQVQVDYMDDGGTAGPTAYATTDGSSLLIAGDPRQRIDVRSLATVTASAPQWPGTGLSEDEVGYLLFDGDITTSGDLNTASGSSYVIDFGDQAELVPTELLALPRTGKATRANGTVVQGSNDGDSWENLSVPLSGAQDGRWSVVSPTGAQAKAFRYLRLTNTSDWSGNLAEVELYGDLSFTDAYIDSRILSTDGKTRASAYLYDEAVADIRERLAAPDADRMALLDELTASASLLKDVSDAYAPIEVPQSGVVASSPSWDGTATASDNGWRLFDGDTSTSPDTKTAEGWVSVDLGDGRSIHVSSIKFRPRDGKADRVNGSEVQASNDGTTWTTLATLTGVSNSNWGSRPVDSDTAYRHLRYFSPNGFANMAELQFLLARPDDSLLRLALDRADEIDPDKYTAESYSALNEARATARTVLENDAPSQEDIDASADNLLDRLTRLERLGDWSASRTYDKDDRVISQDQVYVAQWWTKNESPSATATGSWMRLGSRVSCGADDLRSWTDSWVYVGDEIVEHDGHRWQAKWWSRGEEPGTSSGHGAKPKLTWQDLGTCE